MNEKIPSPESRITDEEVIKALREVGLDSIDVQILLDKWTERQEQTLGLEPEDSVRLNMKRASIYEQAGYIKDALDNLESARIQAAQQKMTELKEEIERKIDELAGGKN